MSKDPQDLSVHTKPFQTDYDDTVHLVSLLTRETFAAWLQSNQDGSVVGYAGLANQCPIARFLQDQDFHEVYVDTLTIDADIASAETPPWAVDFIDRVDFFLKGTVTKEAALQCLDLDKEEQPDERVA